MDKIRILVVSGRDWKTEYNIPQNVKLYSYDKDEIKKKEIFELVIIERNIDENEFKDLKAHSYSYCLFLTDTFEANDVTKELMRQRMGNVLETSNIQSFLDNDAKKYFSKPYGEKFKPSAIGIAQGFQGTVKWDGNYCVSLEGEYGDSLNQIVFWRGNIPIEKGQAIEFWLEYKKDPGVNISLSIRQYVRGTMSDISDYWEFNEEDMENPVVIEGKDKGYLFISVNASGTGKLDIIALHDRLSHHDVGKFMVGGERYVTSNREEIFCYFDPGDFKPPLTVYFSGYKTQEGFEGYYMMRKLGCPFLLISESRFEGGGFYLGNQEFEKLMVEILEKKLAFLGFYNNQMIMSGISMGTVGSMYYGCDLKPHALILGKPLGNLGDIAANERLNRPKGFPTSLDLLHKHAGGMDEAAVERLNDRFWNKFRTTDFSHTKFVVSYMYEDDYDAKTYNKLLSELNSSGVQVYGKGLHGRHNDNTSGITTWFKGQYERILKEDFGR